MAENYIAENNLGGTREQQVAAAAKGLENLAARGDLQGLLHYANMNTAKPMLIEIMMLAINLITVLQV